MEGEEFGFEKDSNPGKLRLLRGDGWVKWWLPDPVKSLSIKNPIPRGRRRPGGP